MPHTAQAHTQEELVHIHEAFDRLITKLQPKLMDDDEDNIREAFKLAVERHNYQRRKSGEPYIFHPIEVARICFEEIGLGPTAIICALLHDIVEDTDTTLNEISTRFGSKVALIVDGLTKLDGLYDKGTEKAANLRKVLSTLVNDVRVVLIKMADRIHNLRTISPMPPHKQLKIAAETMFIYAPLAHRLGLYQVKTEFEDICMKITDPEQYKRLMRKIQDSEEKRELYIQEFLKPLLDPIESIQIPYRVLGRPKSISSIWNKIKKKKVEFEEIYDLFAVRIIIDVEKKDEKRYCWQVYSVITDHYKPIPERLKDWVTSPKGNGYESLHTSVIGPGGRFVEVQIRSERMDDIAERGFAAHWKYKGHMRSDNVYDQWLDNIRTLLENQNGDAIEFLADFRTNLFKEEVYVFTPKGDMRILPKGATALDFAFDIHSDIGAQATSIKINNKLVPMGYRLENGDQVQVTTSKGQTPSESWLKLVITGKARSKIRSALNDKAKQIAAIGKETLQRKMKSLKADFESNADLLYALFGYKNRHELYLGIEDGTVKLSDITKHFTVEAGQLKPIVVKRVEDRKPAPSSSPREKSNALILINDEPGDMYQYDLSNCCNPVPGDEIFAFLTANSGMKIHRTNCKNASNLFTNYDYRILKAEWNDQPARDFVVEIKITGIDTGRGVIQTLINEISNRLMINIKSFSIEGDEGIYECRLRIMVRDKNQLEQSMQSLKELDNISTVERIIN
ncbi:MAG: RelA/SpoT family protein [Bacteroidota bacterium]